MWFVALCGLVALIVAQPLVLELACALTGVKPPGYLGAAAIVALCVVASLVLSLPFGLTVGAAASAVHPALGAVSSWLFGLGITAVACSATLRVSFARGAGVAVVSHLVSSALFAGLWWLSMPLFYCG